MFAQLRMAYKGRQLQMNSALYSFEKLKYIGEVSIDKKIRPVDFALDEKGGFYIADAKTGSICIYNRFGNLVEKKSVGTGRLFSRGGAIEIDNNGNLIIVVINVTEDIQYTESAINNLKQDRRGDEGGGMSDYGGDDF